MYALGPLVFKRTCLSQGSACYSSLKLHGEPSTVLNSSSCLAHRLYRSCNCVKIARRIYSFVLLCLERFTRAKCALCIKICNNFIVIARARGISRLTFGNWIKWCIIITFGNFIRGIWWQITINVLIGNGKCTIQSIGCCIGYFVTNVRYTSRPAQYRPHESAVDVFSGVWIELHQHTKGHIIVSRLF